MYSSRIFVLSILSIAVGVTLYIRVCSSQGWGTSILLFICIASYNYKLWTLRRCPKCGKFMRKEFRRATFLPDYEKCEDDGTAYPIQYWGENNP